VLDIRREQDIETLRSACLAYDHAVTVLTEHVESLAQRLAELEDFDAAQAALDLPDLTPPTAPAAESETEPAVNPKPRDRPATPGHGPTPQPELPIEVKQYELDELPDCDVCGGTMEVMEGQCEEAEEITVIERTLRIALNRRQKYRCRCNANIVTAPGPEKLVAGGRYSVDFALHVAVDKYCDHLPLERQVRRFARQGLDVTSQTLWDQLAALASHVEPTWRALLAGALAEPVLNVDETSWRMMGSKTNPKWTLFGLTSPRLAAYELVGSKSAAQARRILSGFRGTLVVDGYAVYPIVAELEKTIRIAHCWAHARRKFVDATDPPDAVSWIVERIRQLYEIEREIDGPFPGDGPTQGRRLALRNEKSRPLLEEIRDWAFQQGGLRRSAFGKALRYMLKHWDGLTVFVDDPRVPLDNNAAERALRGPVVGRKNFYGNRSKRGAKVAAILYTLIESAKLNGIDPAEYLGRAARSAIRGPGTVTLPF